MAHHRSILYSLTPRWGRERRGWRWWGWGAVGTLPCDGNEGVYLYEHPGYGGRCDRFTSDSPNPRSWAVGNDSASAIKIIGNWTASICQHDNFQGTCARFDTSNGNLTSVSDNNGGTMADQASSLRVSGLAVVAMAVEAATAEVEGRRDASLRRLKITLKMSSGANA